MQTQWSLDKYIEDFTIYESLINIKPGHLGFKPGALLLLLLLLLNYYYLQTDR